MKVRASHIAALAGLACGSAAIAQNTPEIEPNETKAQATAVLAPMAAGHTLTGNTTGAVTTAGPTSVDTFRVKTALDAPGIYRYRLVLTTAGTAGHTGSIRGLNQVAATQAPWAGVIGTPGTTDSTVQTSSATTTPARFNQWYGFGKGEEIYYRVAGVSTTTADYVATLEKTTVTPSAISGTFAAGDIIIKTFGEGHSTDTDIAVYDSNLNFIVGSSNDDEAATAVSGVPGALGTSLQSALKRSYAAGTYYVAISNFNTCNSTPSPSDDDFRTGVILDFPDGLANSSTTGNLNMAFSVNDGVTTVQVPNTKAGAFDVNWFILNVGAGAPTGACCFGAPAYNCSITTAAGCASGGGAYQGDGSACSVCPPAPTGGCCLQDGSCQVVTQLACTNESGTYAGDNVACAQANCPPSGACCFFSGTCTLLTASACATQGGAFLGNNSACGTCPTPYAEVGDAGDLPGSAAVISGSGTLPGITGTLGTGDADMYRIRICDAANFGATTRTLTTVDTQLFLFKTDGTGLAFNDDSPAPATGLQSTLSSVFVGPAGNGEYYLAVSQWDKDPLGAVTLGEIWLDTPFNTERAPDGAAATESIGSWSATTGTGGTYGIALSGACYIGASCYANCDGSTGTPALTANDFQCFINQFASQTAYANCDGSTGTPALTANDFQCFINAFASGCS